MVVRCSGKKASQQGWAVERFSASMPAAVNIYLAVANRQLIVAQRNLTKHVFNDSGARKCVTTNTSGSSVYVCHCGLRRLIENMSVKLRFGLCCNFRGHKLSTFLFILAIDGMQYWP